MCIFLSQHLFFSTIKIKNGFHRQTIELNRKKSKPGHDNHEKMNYSDVRDRENAYPE